MFILWVVYQIEVSLMYLDMTQMLFIFIKFKWLEWFPLISLYNMFRVLWAYYLYSYISCNRGIMSTMLIIDWNRMPILPK